MTDEKLNGIIKALKLCTGSETACKDCPYRASVSPSFFVRCEDTLHEASLEAIEALKAENAALRERLEKAVELPCKIGDILYTITITFSDSYEGDTIVHRNGISLSETVVNEKNIWRMCELVRIGKAFFSKEEAEARLKEL